MLLPLQWIVMKLKRKSKFLKLKKGALNQNYADAVAELENQTKTIGKLEVTIHQLHKKIDESKETDEASINTRVPVA